MSDRPKFFDDLAGVAGGAFSAFAGLREEMTSAVRARVDEVVRRMDLIKREEFEAMAELARRARTQCDALELRVAALEAKAASTEAPDVTVSPAPSADSVAETAPDLVPDAVPDAEPPLPPDEAGLDLGMGPEETESPR